MGSGVKKDTADPSALARSSLILADELHKSVLRKFNKRKVYSQFKDNIWGVDLADMQSLSKKNKGIKYLLCAIDLYSKYAFVIPLKDKKGISIVNGFNQIIKQSNSGKPNKIRVDQGSEVYNNVFKKWLSDNDIIMYSTDNEGKSVVAERFIGTLKNKLYKHMTSNNIKVELDLTNYATKTDLNNITHVNTSSFGSKTNLAALKTEVDKIDVDKLKTSPVDVAKLTNAVENDLLKKLIIMLK